MSNTTVNKADLVGMVADKTETSKSDVAATVDAVLDAITSILKEGREVRLVGFGTFHVTRRKAGEGRNPQTGATIQIAASNQPKFKAGKALKDAIN
ncbi:MAG: hupB [Alphaproteobacteria bacterium]|nr:hupB [Alphaproteobacteria bacterium]